MSEIESRNFGRCQEILEIPNLTEIQTRKYEEFLQLDGEPTKRKNLGLESVLREVFPITSYDGSLRLDYVSYRLGRPRYTPDQCRALRLTYGRPFRVTVRLSGQAYAEPIEEEVYVGELPIMLGGGEFIINGAERVIVSQLHRSPGVDFSMTLETGDRRIHSCRIIPERGSWIEMNVSRKDTLLMRIDQSSKIPVTAFLRAMDAKFADTETLIRLFYETKVLKLNQVKPGTPMQDMYVVAPVVSKETGEVVLKAGERIGEKWDTIRNSALKQLEVVADPQCDPLLLNTLAEDKTSTYNDAILYIYGRLRVGNPPNLDKAKQLFQEKFYDANRYRLGRVGRFRLNRKFGTKVNEDEMTLRAEDFIECIRYILRLRAGEGLTDDIDDLGNRRLRTIDELAGDEIRKGFLKLRRTVQERMSLKDPKELTPRTLVNSKSVSSSIEFFFGRSELSQVVDQTNPLAQLANERRLSALGPGGLNRKRAGFEVRDVHVSHYGRICPIETPEGTNIGLIAQLGIYATVDPYGFLITPYRKVDRGKVNGEVLFMRADEEMQHTLAPADVPLDDHNRIQGDAVVARVKGDFRRVKTEEIEYVDISPKQLVGVSASLIPFLEHDDANRALMGSNMQRQAVPLLAPAPAVVATGMEKPVAQNSGMVVRAAEAGEVAYVDANRIVLRNRDGWETEYLLRKFVGLNERTCLNQKPVVGMGQKVKRGQVLADGPGTSNGELALGRDVLVAFMTCDGYNFEDAIVVSESLLKDDRFTSIHIDEFDVEVRETKLGREEFTRDIPNVSERQLRNLDEQGIIRVGTRVNPGDILVGKVSPKSKTELSPEEKLLHAIFGRAGEDVKNDSLVVPAGTEGVVITAEKYSRVAHLSEQERRRRGREARRIEKDMNDRILTAFQSLVETLNTILHTRIADPVTGREYGRTGDEAALLEQVEKFDYEKLQTRSQSFDEGRETFRREWPKIQELLDDKERQVARLKRGDELPTGVLEMVKVWIATKRTLAVGDKMAGRHGNKGVIARVVPVEDMPFMPDGHPVEILLNPLGVPSRMNVGQILETHLGWAAAVLGFQALTPVFDGCKEDAIHDLLEQAGLPRDGKTVLHDGRTGEPFDQRVTVGHIYMMKLHHLVDDKVHARATGPYSLITQQPLGGKARSGGQRFGEMEVWALEAYGAAYILQELLTVKSDDVEGRTKIYESMVMGRNTLEAGTPVSFDVLCNEIKGLCLNIQLEKKRL
ncbi:MAG: DNA-directed RNA polymerase subunit beta [Planctomycetes bacterium]|nr:DNA-directed RNA polymerase subunit beta [Planctomycetota bacterium]